jgi:hypothetical protein
VGTVSAREGDAMRRLGWAVPALLAAACGGRPDAPAVEVRDAGAGTGALLVQAFVKGEAQAPNASDPSQFRTRIVVRVSRRGVAVDDAAVRVGGIALVRQGAGTYGEPSQLLGMPPAVATLEVTSGADWVRAACSTPGGHLFTRPARGGDVLAFGAGAPLEVDWVRASRADSASLNVGGYAAVGDLDDGSLAIPPGAPGLAPAAAAPVGLWRENRVLLRGGATGSLLSVSVWNGLQVALERR